MKKFFIFFLSVLLAAAFCSCNGQNNNINTGSDGGAKGGGTAASRSGTPWGQAPESGVSLIERAYSYGEFSLPSAGSNPNNNVG